MAPERGLGPKRRNRETGTPAWMGLRARRGPGGLHAAGPRSAARPPRGRVRFAVRRILGHNVGPGSERPERSRGQRRDGEDGGLWRVSGALDRRQRSAAPLQRGQRGRLGSAGAVGEPRGLGPARRLEERPDVAVERLRVVVADGFERERAAEDRAVALVEQARVGENRHAAVGAVADEAAEALPELQALT